MSIEKTVKKTPQQQQSRGGFGGRPGGPGGRPGGLVDLEVEVVDKVIDQEDQDVNLLLKYGNQKHC